MSRVGLFWRRFEESEDSDSEEEEEGDIIEGSIVWAPFNRKKYPAKVVSLKEVPVELHRQLSTKNQDYVCIKYYGENNYSKVDKTKLVLLGEENIDLKYAKSNPLAYHEAILD